jgi:hypothetical protein
VLTAEGQEAYKDNGTYDVGAEHLEVTKRQHIVTELRGEIRDAQPAHIAQTVVLVIISSIFTSVTVVVLSTIAYIL